MLHTGGTFQPLHQVCDIARTCARGDDSLFEQLCPSMSVSSACPLSVFVDLHRHEDRTCSCTLIYCCVCRCRLPRTRPATYTSTLPSDSSPRLFRRPHQCDTQFKTTLHSAPAARRPLADSAETGLLFSTRPARCPLPDSSPQLRRRSRRSRYAPDMCVPPRSLPLPSACSRRRLDGARHAA